MTIKEITNKAAQIFSISADRLFNHIDDAARAGFIAGAEFERNRDKWIYLPQKPKFNKNLNALTSKGRVVLSFIDSTGEFDLQECDQCEDENGEYETIVAWQYHPKPPKNVKE